jgi:hypothetical protein
MLLTIGNQKCSVDALAGTIIYNLNILVMIHDTFYLSIYGEMLLWSLWRPWLLLEVIDNLLFWDLRKTKV